MARQTRIKLVTGLAICLVGLLAALGGPVVVMVALQNGSPANMSQGDQAMAQVLAQFQAMQRAAAISQTVFLVGAGLAGGALLYVLAVLAVWFVGPPDKTTPKPDNKP